MSKETSDVTIRYVKFTKDNIPRGNQSQMSSGSSIGREGCKCEKVTWEEIYLLFSALI